MTYWDAPSLTALCTAFLIFSGESLGLRFFARIRQKSALLADDWLAFLSLLAFISALICLFIGIHIKAYGYSSDESTEAERQARREQLVRVSFGLNISSIFCFAFTKASILHFYRRVFCVSGHHPVLRKVLNASIAIMALWMVIFVLLTVFQCGTHFSAPWDGTQLKYCTLSHPSIEGMAVSDFALDIWLIVLPLYPIFKLKISPTRRLAIAALFLLACVGLVASLARMILVLKIVSVGMIGFHGDDSGMWYSRMCFFWALEMGVCTVAINLPSVWLLFPSMLPGEVFLSADYEAVDED